MEMSRDTMDVCFSFLLSFSSFFRSVSLCSFLLFPLSSLLFSLSLSLSLFLALSPRTLESTLSSSPHNTGSASARSSVSLCRCWWRGVRTVSSSTATWWAPSSLCWPSSPTHGCAPSGTPARWQVTSAHMSSPSLPKRRVQPLNPDRFVRQVVHC